MKAPKPIRVVLENVKRKPPRISVDVIKSATKTQTITVRVSKVRA